MKSFFLTAAIASLIFISMVADGQTILLQENFTTYQGTAGTVPSGWLFTYNACYTTAASSGTSGPNSYKFGIDQATITSPYFNSADSVRFWIKGISTNTSSQFQVLQSPDTVTWTTVTTIIPLSTSGTTVEYALNSNAHYLRFIYTKSAGNLAFDDLQIIENNLLPPVYLSGHIKAYFNHPVNTGVSSGVNAVYVNHGLDDTLINYINRANYTIDIAVYNYIQSAGISNIATAVNNAYTRGVQVRWIYDGSSTNSGLSALNSNIHTLASPTSVNYGIMHNKFMIIDANSATPSDAIVWTGSSNWGDQQLNTDVNNVIIFRDQPLAQAYTTEFNEMWGGTALTPNLTNSKFGPDKSDNTPHTFTIDGKTVELYFSPSDGTNSHIQSALNSAGDDLFFGVYTFTDNSDATIISNRILAGVYCAGIMDQYSTSYTAYATLNPVMGSDLKIYAQGNSIYHNKLVIIDACAPASDPQVLTGSHNWTISANTKNDENAVIIHDDTIANIYYQSFYQNFIDLGGTLQPCITTGDVAPVAVSEMIRFAPNPATAICRINNTSAEELIITVFDITGKIKLRQVIRAGDHALIDVSQWSNSMYFVRAAGDTQTYSYKLLVQH